MQSAQILSKHLNIPLKEFLYIKERNTYGLLCGMEKARAAKEYPELVEAYENEEYVLGSERLGDIKNRSQIAFNKLKALKQDIIAVTHGNFLKAFLPILTDKQLVKKEDGGYILLELQKDIVGVLKSDGIAVR